MCQQVTFSSGLLADLVERRTPRLRFRTTGHTTRSLAPVERTQEDVVGGAPALLLDACVARLPLLVVFLAACRLRSLRSETPQLVSLCERQRGGVERRRRVLPRARLRRFVRHQSHAAGRQRALRALRTAVDVALAHRSDGGVRRGGRAVVGLLPPARDRLQGEATDHRPPLCVCVCSTYAPTPPSYSYYSYTPPTHPAYVSPSHRPPRPESEPLARNPHRLGKVCAHLST